MTELMLDDGPRRRLSLRDQIDCVPVYVVWEITLACNLKCIHCGSRAGHRRAKELSTSECIDVVRQLAELGTREISIIGGEAFVRKDWLTLVRAIRDHGMDCTMQTGGYKLSRDDDRSRRRGRPARPRRFGRRPAAVARSPARRPRLLPRSVARARRLPQRRPDRQRQHADRAADDRRPAGHPRPDDRRGRDELAAAAHGRDGQRGRQPLVALAAVRAARPHAAARGASPRGREHGVALVPGNNIGYFGPFEHLWRGAVEEYGLQCGRDGHRHRVRRHGEGLPVAGDGRLRGGNVRELAIDELWSARALQPPAARMWGFCGTCYYADVCRGGCTWTSHSLLGKAGNNPYCHHRALTLAERGRRERVVKVRRPPTAIRGRAL